MKWLIEFSAKVVYFMSQPKEAYKQLIEELQRIEKGENPLIFQPETTHTFQRSLVYK